MTFSLHQDERTEGRNRDNRCTRRSGGGRSQHGGRGAGSRKESSAVLGTRPWVRGVNILILVLSCLVLGICSVGVVGAVAQGSTVMDAKDTGSDTHDNLIGNDNRDSKSHGGNLLKAEEHSDISPSDSSYESRSGKDIGLETVKSSNLRKVAPPLVGVDTTLEMKQEITPTIFKSKSSAITIFDEDALDKFMQLVDKDLYPPDENSGSLQIPFPGRMGFSHCEGTRRLSLADLASNNSTADYYGNIDSQRQGETENHPTELFSFDLEEDMNISYTYKNDAGFEPMTLEVTEDNSEEGEINYGAGRPADLSFHSSYSAEEEEEEDGSGVLISVNEATKNETYAVALPLGDQRNLAERKDFAVSLGVIAVCTVAGVAASAVSGPLVLVGCIGLGANVLEFLDQMGTDFWGSPSRDDVSVLITAGTVNNAEGNAIGTKYHRVNAPRNNAHEEDMGTVNKGKTESWKTDLDSRTLNSIETFVQNWDDICVANIGYRIGIEPSGTGYQEVIDFSAGIINYLTEGRAGYGTGCLWFGDTATNALEKFEFYWRPAIQCKKAYGDYAYTDDYAYCLRFAMRSYKIHRGFTYMYNGNNQVTLPTWLKSPFRRIRNRYNSGSIDLHQKKIRNWQPVNVRRNKFSEMAQDWDIDRSGRIRSRADPRFCLEAGKFRVLYKKTYLYKCNHEIHQQWSFFTDGRIQNKGHKMYLGVAYCGTQSDPNKQQLELRYYEGGQCGEAQKWSWS